MFCQKMFHQLRGVFPSLPQRRKVQAYSIDSKIELSPKSPRFDFLLKISARRSDQAHVLVAFFTTIWQQRDQKFLVRRVEFVDPIHEHGPWLVFAVISIPAQVG